MRRYPFGVRQLLAALKRSDGPGCLRSCIGYTLCNECVSYRTAWKVKYCLGIGLMNESQRQHPHTCHYFVDEAGDGTLFNKRKRIVVGREGCSLCFIYFLWALQRLYERGEDRYWKYVAAKVSLVHDVDDMRENEYGTYYTKKNPLTLEERKKIELGI